MRILFQIPEELNSLQFRFFGTCPEAQAAVKEAFARVVVKLMCGGAYTGSLLRRAVPQRAFPS